MKEFIRKSLPFALLLVIIKLTSPFISWFTSGVQVLLIYVIERLSESNPKLIANTYFNRFYQIMIVWIACIIATITWTFFHTFEILLNELVSTPSWKRHVLTFVLQGATLGLISRMLLIQFYSQLIRAKETDVTKFLIMTAYYVLVVLFPFSHKAFAPFYMLGFACGFSAHFLAQKNERKDALHTRLCQNIFSTIEDGDINITSNEAAAIALYANRRWNKLKSFLKKNEKNFTAGLFFIKMSMHRKLHEYEKAILALHELRAKGVPWYDDNKHLFELHSALNENEKNSSNATIRDLLQSALAKNENCLLANATNALILANSIGTKSTKEDEELLQTEAIESIQKALEIYERRGDTFMSNDKVNSLITGTTIPVCYSFLLDTFGYVMFKCNRKKFAKALFFQCITQDPLYSATHLHLAELYIQEMKHTYRDNSRIRMAAAVNLHIANYIEEMDNKGNSQSYISTKADLYLANL